MSGTFQKYDDNKVRMELIPPSALKEVGKIFTYGAHKYSPDNWRKGTSKEDRRRILGAVYRHLNAHHSGELRDAESGELHLAHAIVGQLFLLELELKGVDAYSVVDQAPEAPAPASALVGDALYNGEYALSNKRERV